jgi:hypothetical protein
MTKSEMRAIIKDMVKDCIKEAILDDKIFSTIIREVIQNTKEMVLEQNQESYQRQEVVYQQPMVAQAGAQPRQRRSLSEFGGIDLPSRSRDRFEINESSAGKAPAVREEPIREDDSKAFGYATQMADGINTVPLDTIMYLLKGKN